MLAFSLDMGRCSHEKKKMKRKEQKQRKKTIQRQKTRESGLKPEESESGPGLCGSSIGNEPELKSQQSESVIGESRVEVETSLGESETPSIDYATDDVLGIDIAALEMHIADGFKEDDEIDEESKQEYSYDYLVECRDKLRARVEHYQSQLAEERLKKQQIMYRCEEKLHRVRKFYKNIAIAPSRTGKIARAALLKFQTAKQFLNDTMSQMYESKIKQLYSEQSANGCAITS